MLWGKGETPSWKFQLVLAITAIGNCSPRGLMMRNMATRVLTGILLVQAAILFQVRTGRAQASGSAALTGRVSSQEEGPMEGVQISAKKTGSTIKVTVATGQ